MTEMQWKNLKPGDRLICRFKNNWNAIYENKIGTFYKFGTYLNSIEVIWDDKTLICKTWYQHLSFDFLPAKEPDLLNGGAS